MKADQSLENREKYTMYYRDLYCSGCGAQFYIFGLLATIENMNFTVLAFSAARAVMKMFSILYGINFQYFLGINIFVPWQKNEKFDF